MGPFSSGAITALAEAVTCAMPTSAIPFSVGEFRQPLTVLVVASVIVVVAAPEDILPVCMEASVIVSAVHESP
jgi:hypothetical protein